MKKKTLLLITLILLIIGICIALFFIRKSHSQKQKIYQPEVIEPEVFESNEYYMDLIIGLWQSGSVYYRYNEDGTGVTWDVADDVTESEGTKITWEINDNNRFIHFYEMEIGGIIPKSYTITKLDLENLEYQDDFGVKNIYKKIE